MNKSFKKAVQIRESDFDSLGHVNNVVYLQWVQDIAESHWKSLERLELLSEYIWVALRHEIDYLREIKPGEAIMAETYVVTMEGVKSERETTILAAYSNEVKAKSRTIWCLLDAKSKRPKRIPESMKELFL